MPGAESFTVLAILEARDRASEIFDKCGVAMEKFSGTAEEAAGTAREAGDAIDDALLKTASGADALDVATARVEAAQAKAAESAKALAEAETGLLDVQREAAAVADGEAASTDTLIAADARLAAAQKDAAAAAKALSDAQKVQSDTAVAAAAKNDEAAAGTAAVSDASKEGGLSLASMGKIAGITAIGLGIAGAVMIKAAGNFQSATQHLVTDAGESQKNLGMVRTGILQISTATGTSANDITNAMYHIESGGFHAATALDMAKVAAEGAKVGGADLDTVSKTLVGTMNAYYGSTTNASNATQRSTSMMEEMIATVGSGDMRMQDLASSLSSVAPLAASAGISFAQVGGAIATMTAQGMTAQRSTQNLNNVIRNIVKPSAVASNEMRALGLNANQVSMNVGKQGLTGTLNEYTQAILKNSSGGMVTLGYMKQMSPAAQSLAQGILAGTISTGDLTTAVKGLNPEQAALITKFKTAATSATGLKQTYAGAMAALTGGATGLNVALMLTGKNTKTFASDVANITKQGKGAATLTSSWAAIQGTFNQKMDTAKTAVENTGIAIGSALLPAATALLSAIGKILIPVAEWTAKHKTLTEILFVGVTALAATVAILVVVGKTIKAVSSAASEVGKAYKGAVAVVQKLAGVSKQTADQQAADAKKTAAANEKASADSAAAAETSAGESAAAAETGAAETTAANETAAADSADAYAWMAASAETDAAETAAVNEEAAATTSGSWIASAASTVAGWAVAGAKMIGQAAAWVAQNAVKVGMVVASNVAGALVAAGAWIAANAVMLLGIGLIIAAVVVAVLLIVKYWKQISAAAVAVWHDIVAGAEAAWSGITSFVARIWDDITGDVRAAHAMIMGIVSAAWAFVRSLINREISNVKTILGWFGKLGSLFRGWWHDATSAVTSETGKMLSFVESIPGRILHALSSLASDMLSAGEDVVRGIWNGISGMGGWLWNQVKGFASNTLHSFESALGIGSPSKYTTEHGQMLAAGLGLGITAGTGAAVAKAQAMAFEVIDATKALDAARGGSMTQAGRGLPQGLMAGLKAGSPQAVAQAQQLAERTIAATDALNKAKAGKMHDAGQGLVQGIWNGISGDASWLMSQVSGFAGSVLHGISSALGIGSPSKYTTAHGQMLGQGLANGILSSIPKAVGAAGRMAASVLAATSGLSASALQAQGGTLGIGSSLALSASSAAGGGSGTMNVTIDLRGATVASDASINTLATKVGNALVKQLAPAGYKIRTV